MSDKALVGNAADPEQVAKATKKGALARIQQMNDLRQVMSTRSGRRVLWGLLAECGVFRTSFHTNGSIVYFNEGMRQIGLKLLADLNEADEAAYALMASEGKKEREAS